MNASVHLSRDYCATMSFSKLEKKVKKYLRHSQWTSGRRIRAESWKELCRDANMETQKLTYREMSAKFNENNGKCSPFDENSLDFSDKELKESGKMTLTRLLAAVEQIRPDFSFIPALYPLAALFLNYMQEEEAFVCLINLLSPCHKFFIQSDISTNATKRTLISLINKHASRAYSHFQHLVGSKDDKDLIPIVDDWKNWIFRDLPFSHLACIVDCYFHEGQKILFRIALALINLWFKEKSDKLLINKRLTCRQLAVEISAFCQDCKVPAHKLLKTAFAIRNLKMDDIQLLQHTHETMLRQYDSLSLKSAFSLSYQDVGESSNILKEDQMCDLYQCIPVRYQIQTLAKLYSLNEDGTSFTNLWSKIESFAPTIIVVRSSRDEIFGAYCSEAWNIRRKTLKMTYFGTGETFLFKFCPSFCKFPWVGCLKPNVEHGESLFQAADTLTLLVGGGALSIRNSLTRGTSETCSTFDNPPLSVDMDFEIVAFEVFGFVDDDY